MTDAAQSTSLKNIFSFFLGLMVTAFIGVGVYTFHPPPDTKFSRQMREFDRQEQAVRMSRSPEQLSPEERVGLQKLAVSRDSLNDVNRAAQETWGRSTSIILIAFATLVMAISLIHAVQLPVISNGLLLGGLFTMVYGVGWIVATDTSVARFIFMTVALAITLGLGYLRFVRRQVVGSPVDGPRSSAGNVNYAEIQARLRRIEERMNDAAAALGKNAEP